MLSTLTLTLLLIGCVEDVSKDKVEAVVEDVKPAADQVKEAAPAPEGDTWSVVMESSSIKALGAKVTATHSIDFHDWSATASVQDDHVPRQGPVLET